MNSLETQHCIKWLYNQCYSLLVPNKSTYFYLRPIAASAISMHHLQPKMMHRAA